MDGLFAIEPPETDLGAFFDRNDVPWFVDLKSSNFFAVQPSGDPADDQALGEFVANEVLAYARRHRNGAVIALALSSIADRPVSQLEAGFIIRIAAAAMVASQN